MKNLLFPFEKIRRHQDSLIDDTFNTIKNKSNLIVHAPTGLGKTAATLSPALTLAIKYGYTVFFLTPKHTQHRIAIETLKRINQKYNLEIAAADFIGKQWMCSNDISNEMSSGEFNEYCKDLREQETCFFFNGVWGKKHQLQGKASNLLLKLKRKNPLHVEELINECKQEECCAYEICSLIGKEAKIIIADYFHIFHPRVKEAFLKRIDKQIENSIIIVDEAHNLPDRLRDILTSRVNSFVLGRAAKEASYYKFSELSIGLNYFKDALDELAKSNLNDKDEAYVKKEEFIDVLEKYTGYKYEDLKDEIETLAVQVRKDAKRCFSGSIAGFMDHWLGSDIAYTRIIQKQISGKGKKYINLTYRCLDPSISSRDVIQNSIATIAMSGTLTPQVMYRDLLGFPLDKTAMKSYDSPFPEGNRLVLISPEVTTKFTNRTPEEFKKIADLSANIANNVPHNSAVFFPSYFMMNSVKDLFISKIQKKFFVEQQSMTKEQKQQMLDDFKANSKNGAILLGVQGGNFAEGVDLPGNYLQAAIIVGVPLGTPDLETKSLIEFYDYKFNKGWDYGYIFPAMTRSLQAAGRCIRSSKDRGVIVFLDKRFEWRNYYKCIPPDWKPMITKLAGPKIKRFFAEK